MKSCVLKFLDIATSDKNAWQRRSFFPLSFALLPRKEFSVLLFSFSFGGLSIIGYEWVLLGVCMCVPGKERGI